jgi:hypothetical protein
MTLLHAESPSRPTTSSGRVIWPGYLLFFLMLFLPTSYRSPKAALLGVTLLMVLAKIMIERRVRVQPAIMALTLLFAIVGSFFILIGLFDGAPGALRAGTVFVLWPLIYTTLLGGISQRRHIAGLVKVALYAALAIEAYTLIYILVARGLLPGWLYVELDQGQRVGFYEGFTRYALYSTSSLFFLIPMMIAMLFTWRDESVTGVRRSLIWIGILLGLVLVVLSGRRALLGSVIVALPTTIALRRALPRQKSRRRTVTVRTVIGLGVLCILAYQYAATNFGITASSLQEYVLDPFVSDTSRTGTIRTEQSKALISAWRQRPLLGWGFGAVAPGSISSEDAPWVYELSYHALLFHVGLVGVLFYASGITWIYVQGIRLIRRGSGLSLLMVPILTGTSCFLIANGSNPYLEKFDYLWVLFLPVAIINTWLMTEHRSSRGLGASG